MLLKAEGNQAWVGLICNFFEEESEDEGSVKMAKFLWFLSEKEIRNKSTKRTDFLPVCLQCLFSCVQHRLPCAERAIHLACL